MKERWIQFSSLMVIGAGALLMSEKAKATQEMQPCNGQQICNIGCPGNITLFCETWAGCTPGNPGYSYCIPDGCGFPYDRIVCGGAA